MLSTEANYWHMKHHAASLRQQGYLSRELLWHPAVTMVMYMFSGVMMSRGSTSAAATIPELTASSGSAYLYFYSDAAVNMSGFSIRYWYVRYANDLGCIW